MGLIDNDVPITVEGDSHIVNRKVEFPGSLVPEMGMVDEVVESFWIEVVVKTEIEFTHLFSLGNGDRLENRYRDGFFLEIESFTMGVRPERLGSSWFFGHYPT